MWREAVSRRDTCLCSTCPTKYRSPSTRTHPLANTFRWRDATTTPIAPAKPESSRARLAELLGRCCYIVGSVGWQVRAHVLSFVPHAVCFLHRGLLKYSALCSTHPYRRGRVSARERVRLRNEQTAIHEMGLQPPHGSDAMAHAMGVVASSRFVG